MRKSVMIMFSVLMAILFVLPLTVQAEKGMPGSEVKDEGVRMGEWHRDWFSSLNLDEDVLEKIQELKLKHKEKMIELNSKIAKKELGFEKVLLEKELNFSKLLSVYDEISDLRQELERQMIEHKIEIYKLIPDDKKEEAKKMFLHKFCGPGHEGMPGGPGKPGCPMKK